MSSLNFMELCRLCLVKERVSIPIFEGEGDVRQILLKIAACLPVKIARDDKLPKKICDECMYKLDNAYQFWNTTANAEKQLLQWLGDIAIEDRKNVPSNTIETEQLVLKEETIEQETPDVSKNLSRVEAVLDDERGVSDDEDTESEEEGSNSEDTGDDEPPGKEEAESEEEPYEPLEPTTFVNVSLAGCDEAGPSGIQQPAQAAATQPAQEQQPQAAPSTSSAAAATAAAPASAAAAAASAPSGSAGVQSLGFSLKATPFLTGAKTQLVYILPPLVANSIMLNGASPVRLNTPPGVRNILPNNKQIGSSVLLKDSSGSERIMLGSASTTLNNTQNNIQVGSAEPLNGSPGNKNSILQNALMAPSKPLLLNPYPVAGNPLVFTGLAMAYGPFPNTVPPPIHCIQSNVQVPLLQPNDVINLKSDVKLKEEPTVVNVQSTADSSVASTIQSTKPCDPDFLCGACGKKFSSKGKLTKHTKTHNENRPFECSVCSRKFKEKYQMKKHELIHKNVKKFKCGACGYSSLYKSALQFHLKRHTNSFSLFCDICNKGFFSKGSLESHKDLHAGRTFQCETCGVLYPNYNSYQCHRLKKHPELWSREYLCKDCGKNFPSMQAFKNHNQKHAKVKNKHVCDVCGKVLNSRNSLTVHIRTHTGEKPFNCKVCGKGFIGQVGLKVHNLTHTGERPHACDECGKRFTQRSSLVVHKRYHSGFKPFHCQICTKNFVTKTLLKTHQKTRHKEQSILC